jgi:SAM-dependent methyltransferase
MGSTNLRLPGNRDIYAGLLEFRNRLEQVKTQHPLVSPYRYYPYGTLYNIDQMLPILDNHEVDLKQWVRGQTILDLGSGDGQLSFFLELFDPARIIAIDASPFNYNSLEGFRALKTALQSKVELIDADVHYLDFDPLPHFDVIFCLGFLYHSPHPMWILEKLARSTRMLFLNTKVFDAEESYAYFYDVAECNNDASNWWCFTPKTVGLMLKRAGFSLEFMQRVDTNLGSSHPVDMSRDGRVFACCRR